MKALTVEQPIASLVALGEITVLNRRWSTAYRGTLAIHAGPLRLPVGMLADEALRDHALAADQIPTGVVVALATLDDAHWSSGYCCVPWGDPSQGYIHLLLTNVRPLRRPVSAPTHGGMRLLSATEIADLHGAL